jgi:hypothetical protein
MLTEVKTALHISFDSLTSNNMTAVRTSEVRVTQVSLYVKLEFRVVTDSRKVVTSRNELTDPRRSSLRHEFLSY